ncbi:MAG: hypothetical protein R6X02_16480 [Enhygromyxa sp.]
MTRPRRSAACAAVVGLLASGCASKHEESSRQEAAPASERDYEAAPTLDAEEEDRLAPEPTPGAEGFAEPRSLEDIQRELAANNAKLRELGVELPGDRPADAPAGGATKSKSTTTTAPSTPGDRSGAKPSKPKAEEGKPPRRDKSSGKKTISDDVGSPDPAKAAPRSPQGGLDAAARCEQVCDLAAISCGLGDQICELADRHPDESDYASACERANLDCEVAKEACDACVE